jgi:hypothetical protein
MIAEAWDVILSTTLSKSWGKVWPNVQQDANFLFFLSCGSTVLLDPGRLTYRRFLEPFRHMVGLLGRVISPSQGLYLHRTTQHGKTRTNIHALSGIRTHDPRNQPAKTHASDRTATVTGLARRRLRCRKIC